MPGRTINAFALPLVACVLTCLTIGLTVRLAATKSAHLSLIAHAGSPRAALLPLSRLPAKATNEERIAAWGNESSYYLMMAVKADAAARHNPYAGTKNGCSAHSVPCGTWHWLRSGDLTRSEVWAYTMQETQQKPLFLLARDKAHKAMTYSVPVAVGGEHRIRIDWTRTATGLHTATTSLPDLPSTP